MNESHQGVELVVGIPTFNEEGSIGFVVEQVDKGIRRHFPEIAAVIVNVDNASPDDTRTTFLKTNTTTPKEYISTPLGVVGKGNNFHNLFKFVENRSETVRAVVVVDADLKSITPNWVQRLARPILDGFDFVLPLYSRHQFDGTITNHICYPLIYALLEQDIRQPIGGEFAFSPALVKHWLGLEWEKSTGEYGINIFMTGNAVTGGFKICEVGLGAKIHRASAPKLGLMFLQVVTTLFELLLQNKEHWSKSSLSSPHRPKRFGPVQLDPPQDLKINIRQMKEQLREEYLPQAELLGELLDDYTMTRLRSMFDQDHYSMDTLMWTQIIYRLLKEYDGASTSMRKQVIEALRPLYFARMVAYDYLTWRYSVTYAEAAFVEQAEAFAAQKPFLLGLYR